MTKNKKAEQEEVRELPGAMKAEFEKAIKALEVAEAENVTALQKATMPGCYPGVVRCDKCFCWHNVSRYDTEATCQKCAGRAVRIDVRPWGLQKLELWQCIRCGNVQILNTVLDLWATADAKMHNKPLPTLDEISGDTWKLFSGKEKDRGEV